jgi:hypothetical protein
MTFICYQPLFNQSYPSCMKGVYAPTPWAPRLCLIRIWCSNIPKYVKYEIPYDKWSHLELSLISTFKKHVQDVWIIDPQSEWCDSSHPSEWCDSSDECFSPSGWNSKWFLTSRAASAMQLLVLIQPLRPACREYQAPTLRFGAPPCNTEDRGFIVQYPLVN